MALHLEDISVAGRSVPFSIVTLGPGVIVVAVSSDGIVHLVEQFRPAYGGLSTECIGGRVEPGESAGHAAKRELQEETGIEAAHWTTLGEFWPHTAKVAAIASLWLATGLTFKRPAPEPGEQLRVVPTPFPKALAMVRDNRIVHAPSALALLLAATYRQEVGANPCGSPRAL